MSGPKVAAIIMDGNRRWAKKNNLPSSSGHRKGIEVLIEVVKIAKDNSCLLYTSPSPRDH